jgi:transcription termination/antitermination protein NusG
MGNEADDELEHAGEDEQPLEPADQKPPTSLNGDGPEAEYDFVEPSAEDAQPEAGSDSGTGAGAPPAEGEPPDEAAPSGESAPLGEIGSEDGRNWFVIHCYSGYENKVRHNLEQRIESMGMKGKIFDVVVPTEEEIEVKDGKRRTVERRVFPGYLLVQMVMSEDSWYVVRNTPGVTGFVGMGNVPTPLRPEEVAQILRRMEAEAPKVKVTFKPSQKVRIVDGPFNDFIGTVAEIDMDRAKVRVMVSFFGRETPVELDFLQVEKV